MITFNLRKPDINFSDDNASIVGENLSFEEEFVIRGLAVEGMSFVFHLRFSDGLVNSVLPESVNIIDGNTHLVWLIRKNDIFSHGYFEFQIEGRKDDTVFQTEIIRLCAKESLPVEDKEYENPNSETLALRDEMYNLNQIAQEYQEFIRNNKPLTISDISGLLAEKEDTVNKVNGPQFVTDEMVCYPSVSYLNQFYYQYSEIDALLSQKADNIFSSKDNYIEQTLSDKVSGSFLSEYSGSELEGENFEHTAKIPCTAGDEFKVTATYGFHAPLAVFYNEDERFISYYLLNSTEVVSVTDEIIKVPVGAAYIAFNNNVNYSTFSVSKNIPILVTVAEKIAENSEKVTVNSEDISDLKSEITTKADNIFSNDSQFETVALSIVEGRYARYDDGTYTELSSLECSEPVECSKGDVFRVTSVYGYSAPLAVFYDSDGNFIGYFNIINGAWKENADAEIVTVPENAAAVVFNNLSAKAELTVEKAIPVSLKEQIENNTADIAQLGKSVLYGKTIYCDGDSVAYGAGSEGYSYCDFIADNNGMQMTKKAVSGTTFAVREGRTDSIYERISALCSSGKEYDYILLEGGFNDMFIGIDIGSISESDYSGGYDTSTSAGAFEQICYLLKTTFPETKILFVLGHRILRGSCDTKQLPYWEIYRSICEKWSIPYVDLTKESGLIGWKDDETGYAINDKYFQISESTGHGDGTHPLRDTYEKFYVPLIESKLKN